jgi:hypothetical protein
LRLTFRPQAAQLTASNLFTLALPTALAVVNFFIAWSFSPVAAASGAGLSLSRHRAIKLKNSTQMPTLLFFLSVIDCLFKLIEKIFQRMYLFEWG